MAMVMGSWWWWWWWWYCCAAATADGTSDKWNIANAGPKYQQNTTRRSRERPPPLPLPHQPTIHQPFFFTPCPQPFATGTHPIINRNRYRSPRPTYHRQRNSPSSRHRLGSPRPAGSKTGSMSGAPRARSSVKRGGGGVTVPYQLRKELAVLYKFYSNPGNELSHPQTIASYIQRLLPFVPSIDRTAIVAKLPISPTELKAAEDRLIAHATVWAQRRNDPIFDDIKPNRSLNRSPRREGSLPPAPRPAPAPAPKLDHLTDALSKTNIHEERASTPGGFTSSNFDTRAANLFHF